LPNSSEKVLSFLLLVMNALKGPVVFKKKVKYLDRMFLNCRYFLEMDGFEMYYQPLKCTRCVYQLAVRENVNGSCCQVTIHSLLDQESLEGGM
jgi:hypothetical protein